MQKVRSITQVKKIFFIVFLLANVCCQAFAASAYPPGFFDSGTQKLDPQTETFLKAFYKKPPPPLHAMSVTELRNYGASFAVEIPTHPKMETIEDVSISGPDGPFGLRIYKPKSTTNKPLPVFIYIHGGGWVTGSPKQYEAFIQEISVQTPCMVVAVDYGLSPENPFPKALHECYFATEWVAEHIQEKGGDPKRIAIGGDSAGGNLAAAVTLLARQYKKPSFVCQVLICPVTNCNFETLSYYEFSEGYFLTKASMRYFWDKYIGQDKALKDTPLVSPLQADSLADLPPAFLVIANFDPLRDEGLAYGLRLHREGVPTEIRRFNSIHGFYKMTNLDVSKDSIAFITQKLSK